jgi:hypothetical protein
MYPDRGKCKTADKPLSLARQLGRLRRWVMRTAEGWRAIPPRTDWGCPVAFNGCTWSTLASARRAAAAGAAVGVVIGGAVVPVDLITPKPAGVRK